MRLIPKYQKGKNIDPVQEAYKNSHFSDPNVIATIRNAIKKEGRDPYMSPDTLAYVDWWLAKKGLPQVQRDAIVGNIIVESGGRPSLASNTGPKPTYYGLLQLSQERLPKRLKGLEGLNYQLEQLWESINDPRPPHWGHGGKGTGFKTAKEAHDVFMGDPEALKNHNVPSSYNILNLDRNKVVQAFVDGYERPLNRKNDNVLRATAAKYVGLTRKK